jgi:membrane protein
MRRHFIILKGGVNLFLDRSCFNRAAAVSFYAFFSLIPIMLFVTAGLGFILGTRAGLLEKVIDMTKVSLPYLSDSVISDLQGLAAAWKTFGWLSILILLSSAEMVLNSTAEALTTIFGMRKRWGFFRRRIVNVLVLLMAIFTALFSIMVTAAAKIITDLDTTVFGIDLGYYLIESLTLKYIMPFVIVVVAAAGVFRIFSGPHLNFRYALYGSLLFTVTWEIAKHLFALYISYFPSYNKFYGSLGAIMVLLLWLFFSLSILLFSASIARVAYLENVVKRRVPSE